MQKYEVSEISPNKNDKTLSNFDIFNICWWKGRAIRILLPKIKAHYAKCTKIFGNKGRF